jgi:hypothetical protein
MKNKIISRDKIYLIITNLIRLFVIIAFVGGIFEKEWIVVFISMLTLFLTFLPQIVERNYKIHLPIEFELAIILFMYSALVLGEVRGYYTRFWWWDIVLHAGSGIALGFAGFIIMYILYKGNKIKANPLTIAIFSFCFAFAIGSLWEIFEFIMDSLISTNMQKSNTDTMRDLIVDGIGSLITASLGYWYLKREKIHFFNNLIKKFQKENPDMFKK